MADEGEEANDVRLLARRMSEHKAASVHALLDHNERMSRMDDKLLDVPAKDESKCARETKSAKLLRWCKAFVDYSTPITLCFVLGMYTSSWWGAFIWRNSSFHHVSNV